METPKYGANIPQDRYFAKDPAEDLIQHCQAKRRLYLDDLRTKGILEKVRRNLLYYHGDRFSESGDGMAIKPGGEEGQFAILQVNQFRSILKLLITYVIQSPPSLDAVVLNSDERSIEQAKFGNQLADYYSEAERINELFYKLIETAIIYSAGYILCLWDMMKGQIVDAQMPVETADDMYSEPQVGRLIYEGDIEDTVLTLFDVCYDTGIVNYEDANWVLCRKRVNKWDLVEMYPEKGEDLRQFSKEDEIDQEFEVRNIEETHTDCVWKYFFLHKPTPSIPNGRMVCFVGDIVLLDTALPIDSLPIIRLAPSEVVGTPHGYSDAWDFQAIQEAIDATVSNIITDHNTTSGKKIHVGTSGAINYSDLEPGTKIIATDAPVSVLDMRGGNTEMIKFYDVLVVMMESMSGMSATARGTADPRVKSGIAIALTESRAQQTTSRLVSAYFQSVEDWGTILIKQLQANAQTQRVISIVGVNRQRHLKEFSAESIKDIKRMALKPSPAITRTLAGRIEIANAIMSIPGMVKTPEALLDVYLTGSLDKITEATESQLRIISSENEALLKGLPVEVSIAHDHVQHVRRHIATLDQPEMYKDSIVTGSVLAHISAHVEMMMQPQVQMLMMQLGYQMPPISSPPQLAPPSPEGSPGKQEPGSMEIAAAKLKGQSVPMAGAA